MIAKRSCGGNRRAEDPEEVEEGSGRNLGSAVEERRDVGDPRHSMIAETPCARKDSES